MEEEYEGATLRLFVVKAKGFSKIRPKEIFSFYMAVETADVVEEDLGCAFITATQQFFGKEARRTWENLRVSILVC